MEQKESKQRGGIAVKPHFSKEIIKQAVAAVERGARRREVIERYGMSKSTLSEWMREYGSSSYQQSIRPLSTVDQRSLVRAIEEGGMSIVEAKKIFRLRSTDTVKGYLRRAAKEKAELSRIAQLMDKNEARTEPVNATNIEALKKALQEAELKIKALNTLIDVAEDQYKIDIRKKPGAKQSFE